jgi:hypothetical protein
VPLLEVNLLEVVLLALCVSWFMRSARADKRSPLLWGALSLSTWLLTRLLFGFGMFGALFSQILLLAGHTGWEMWRERSTRPGRDP